MAVLGILDFEPMTRASRTAACKATCLIDDRTVLSSGIMEKQSHKKTFLTKKIAQNEKIGSTIRFPSSLMLGPDQTAV